MPLPDRNYAFITDADFASERVPDWIAVLPLAATEQHGEHLPPQTDWIIAEGIVEAVKSRLPAHMPVTFLPVEKTGYSIEHSNRPGCETLAWDEAIRRWIAIGEAIADKGIRKLVMLNAHGGNAPLMTIIATELRVRRKMLAVATSWTRFGYPGGAISENEKAYGIHGGEIETSVMLALKPELVHMDKTRNFPSLQYELAQTAKHLRAYGPHAFGWMASDLNPHGVTGNARQADLANGKAMIARAADGFVELLHDVAAFDVTRFDRE
ncbi:MAG: creatininase family protein [Rhizobiaceae bacterium]